MNKMYVWKWDSDMSCPISMKISRANIPLIVSNCAKGELYKWLGFHYRTFTSVLSIELHA